MIEFIKKLLDNKDSTSSKSFFMLGTFIVGSLMILIAGVVILIDVLDNGKIDTDLLGVATYITSCIAIYAAGGLTKVLGDKTNKKE